MQRAGALGLILLAGASWAQEALPLPSGGEAWLQEVLSNVPGNGLTYRFRFVQEGFEMSEERFEAVMGDLEYLCTTYAVPRLPNMGPTPNQVVISLASAPGEFGVQNPAIVQVFEAYRVENGACIWEEF
ncbi:DUF6497 family protein [Roseovarius sp. E0-M6]|uniref:DUF6497 family protein n=1 Tax=Roseovarius sp. E0-M6 TaxID=3127118 RepID=UPI00300FA00F